MIVCDILESDGTLELLSGKDTLVLETDEDLYIGGHLAGSGSNARLRFGENPLSSVYHLTRGLACWWPAARRRHLDLECNRSDGSVGAPQDY